MDVPIKNPKAQVRALRAYLRRHWQRALQIREKIGLSEEALHILLAGGVGLIGGLITVVFNHAVELLQNLFLGFQERSFFEVGDVGTLLIRLATPALGALAAGLILYWGIRLVGKQNTSNLLEVVVAGDGRLPFRTGIIRALSSMTSIATGASLGREGAITQLAATFSSKWGQLAHWQPYRLRLLVACGAASGMAAAYNAPIAGAVFAAQIVLGNFAMNLFAPLLFSSVIASMLARSFSGGHTLYEVPAFNFTSLGQLPWFILLGAMSGLLGALFLKLLVCTEELFKKIPALYLRLACGGLLAGIIALVYPEVRGNGYLAANDILHGHYGMKILIAIFIAKLLATTLTVGSGAVGGVFTPTLFLGVSLGTFWGMILQHFDLAPHNLPLGVFALVGMGSVLSATTRSPLLAIIMIFEISLNYSLMPALMLGCAVSTLVSRAFHPNSIYTEPLRMRSLEVESYRLGAATEQTVGDLMHAQIEPILDTTPLPEIAERFLGSTNNNLPVVDENHRLVGLVALQDLKEYLSDGRELMPVIASDVMRTVPICLTPNQRILEVLPEILASEQRNIPIINNLSEHRLIGSLPRAETLGILTETLSAKPPHESGPQSTEKPAPQSQPPKPR